MSTSYRVGFPAEKERKMQSALRVCGLVLACLMVCVHSLGCSDGGSSGDGGAAGTGGIAGVGGTGGDGGTGGLEPECLPLQQPIGREAPPAAAVDHAVTPDAFADELSSPFPTNASWKGLIVGAGDTGINGFPYLLQTTNAGLVVTPPGVIEEAKGWRPDLTPAWRLSSNEPLTDRQVTAYDALSVTVRWETGSGDSVEAPLVQGMPYISLRYAGATPRLEATSAIVAVDGATPPRVTGDRFEVSLGNGQTWLVYASETVTFNVEGSALAATEPFGGFVRVALLPDGADAAVLDASAKAVPVGGEVELTGCTSEGQIGFRFAQEGEGPLLMMGLPHHQALLGNDETRAALTYRTIRGEMFGVLGDAWTMTMPLDPGGFDPPRGIAPERVDAVRAALVADQNLTNTQVSSYFGGKQVAAMARLALIADALEEDDIAEGIRTRLATQLAPWLAGSMPRFRYDRTWGGIVAAGGELDPDLFFGQGYYNDHHFHYGYHLYAAAVLAKGDPDWLAENQGRVDALARDIANPSAEDPFFTPFRSLDWYVGHSWASGLFVYPQNQESTSEAVNAWYALTLWGEVTNRVALRRLGQLMTAQEILGAQTYWQIEPGSPIYGDGVFSQNRVVGILFDGAAFYDTFFGDNAEFIHGIQYLPFTPVTERLLDPAWMREAYPVVSAALTRPAPPIEQGWRGFIYMAHAVFEPDLAWDEVQSLTAYDDGNSKTNTLWWVATRP